MTHKTIHQSLSALFKVAAIALAATLAACGGGGGGSSSTPTPPVIADTVSAAGTLDTTNYTSDYTLGSIKQTAFDALNAARIASGAGTIAQDPLIDIAAQAHADYLTEMLTRAANGEFSSDQIQRGANMHTEYSDLVASTTFYGTNVSDRLTRAGATGTGVSTYTEGISGTIGEDGSGCVAQMLNSVYHAEVMLSASTKVGIGRFVDSAGTRGCVMDFMAKTSPAQVPAAGQLVVNPAPGATVDGLFYIGYESPRPAPDLIPTLTAGSPVYVSMRNADYINDQGKGSVTVTISSFVVKDSNNATVDGIVLAGSGITASLNGVNFTTDPRLGYVSTFFVPRNQLPAGQYTVNFSGAINGKTVSKSWSFTAK